MSGIIGELGYTGETHHRLMRIIEEISESGNLEKFAMFKVDVEEAISNRNSLSSYERNAVADVLKNDYVEDVRNGKYLDEFQNLVKYAERELTEKDEDEIIEEVLMYVFEERKEQIAGYLSETQERESLEKSAGQNMLQIYSYLKNV
ncbi:MAG TPA: hypothetical protein VJ208_02880 [Candidatus Nanoarchaeia archaeon]|nr:hypothetical protein [Candidatus Nanoarchaeia archaeon]